MKAINLILIFACGSHVASCQQIEELNYEMVAEAVDVSGNPLEGIQVTTGRLEPVGDGSIPMANPVTTESVLTDVQGKAFIKFKSVPEASGNVTFFQDGYYSTKKRIEWNRSDGFNGKTRKASVRAILKAIKNPIPMHAHDNSGAMDKIASIPELNKEYGFDLKKAEPLPPLGTGEVADFTFIVSGYHHGDGNYDLKLEVNFSNPMDGVVEFMTPQRTGVREPVDSGSSLISGYEAPETGYERNIVRNLKRGGIESRHESDVDFQRNFYFRTRTVTDSSGKIVSANYGKIYGDFQFDAANKDWGYLSTLALVTAYFNPSPNDRNVEFDPKRNLTLGSNVMRP